MREAQSIHVKFIRAAVNRGSGVSRARDMWGVGFPGSGAQDRSGPLGTAWDHSGSLGTTRDHPGPPGSTPGSLRTARDRSAPPKAACVYIYRLDVILLAPASACAAISCVLFSVTSIHNSGMLCHVPAGGLAAPRSPLPGVLAITAARTARGVVHPGHHDHCCVPRVVRSR